MNSYIRTSRLAYVTTYKLQNSIVASTYMLECLSNYMYSECYTNKYANIKINKKYMYYRMRAF